MARQSFYIPPARSALIATPIARTHTGRGGKLYAFEGPGRQRWLEHRQCCFSGDSSHGTALRRRTSSLAAGGVQCDCDETSFGGDYSYGSERSIFAILTIKLEESHGTLRCGLLCTKTRAVKCHSYASELGRAQLTSPLSEILSLTSLASSTKCLVSLAHRVSQLFAC